MSEYAPLIVDLVIVGIISISASLAYARGIVREFLTIAAVAAAAAGSYYLFTQTGLRQYTQRWVTNELVADGITAVAGFVVVLVIALLVSHPVSEKVRASNLGFLDRWLGFAWGAVRGGLIVAVLSVPLQAVVPEEEQPAWLRDAQLLGYVKVGGNLLVRAVTDAWPGNDGREWITGTTL